MSSFSWQIAYLGFSAYCATRFALEGYGEALAADGVLGHLHLGGEQVRAWEQLSRSTAFPAPALSGT